jgi:hypothetical protein
MASEGSPEGSVSSCSVARTSSSETTSDFAHPSGPGPLAGGQRPAAGRAGACRRPLRQGGDGRASRRGSGGRRVNITDRHDPQLLTIPRANSLKGPGLHCVPGHWGAGILVTCAGWVRSCDGGPHRGRSGRARSSICPQNRSRARGRPACHGPGPTLGLRASARWRRQNASLSSTR